MITPKDHMSHDLSYFSGPRTSGAAGRRGRSSLSTDIPNAKAARSQGQTLTNIVGRVAGRGQGVMSGGFLSEAKVGQLEEGILPLRGVQ